MNPPSDTGSLGWAATECSTGGHVWTETRTRRIGSVDLKKIENQTIEGQSLSMDDTAFINCIIKDCILEYSGSSFKLIDTELKSCRYVFYGPARGTVHFLQSVGMMPPASSEWGEHNDRVN
jgi:hypothetical protein